MYHSTVKKTKKKNLVEGSGEVRDFLLPVVVRVLPPVDLELEPANSVTPFTSRGRVKRFRGGLVFEAHRLLYHSTLGLRVIKRERADL